MDAAEKERFRQGAVNNFPTTRWLENSHQNYKENWVKTKIK